MLFEMRIVFAGTPAFAAVALQALVDAGFVVTLVLTQPDRAAGRGLRASESDVKRVAQANAIDVLQPLSLKDAGTQAQLRQSAAEVMVVAAYGLILPRAVLDLFPAGCINIHASILPRWRGAAPIQRAILAGDARSGVSIMRMDVGLDTGPVYATRVIDLEKDERAGSLHDKLAALGASTLVALLPQIVAGHLQPERQPESGITYAHKISKQESLLDWTRDARQLERQIRAFDPFPGAYSLLEGQPVKIWRATVLSVKGDPPGIVMQSGPTGIDVACGQDSLRITELQRAGGRRLPIGEFLRGTPISTSARFGA
ncbi:MAG: methionyl-tRNA formyltransferase [Burkholderiales bacterium]